MLEINDIGYGTAIDWAYDELGRLTEERYDFRNNGAADAEDFIARYAYDLASNRVSLLKDTGNANPASFAVDEAFSYLYDANDRLLREQIDTGANGSIDKTVLYKYGPNANFTNPQAPYGGDWTVQTFRGEYAGDNPTGSGNTTQETSRTYNLQGRLDTVTIDANGTAGADGVTTHSYQYNDAGHRVEETNQGTTTLYLIDPHNHTGYAQVLEQGIDANSNGTLDASEINRTYTLGLDVVAQWSTANGVRYLVYDGHGSTRALVTSAGAVVSGQRFAYDAFGNLQSGTGLGTLANAQTNLLYSGEWRDKDTGLDNLRARYYDPRNGLFFTLDPFAGNTQDPLSLHKYLYAHANPVMMVDPSGLFSIVGLSAANAIGTMLNTITAHAGQAVGASLGADVYVDPIDILLSRDVGLLPDSVYDAIDRAIGFAQQNAPLVLGSGLAVFGVVVTQRQLTLFDKFASHNNTVADLLSPGITQLIHQTLKHRGALRATAKQIHSLVRDEIGLKQSTIALAEVKLPNGTKAVFGAASGRGLRQAQKDALVNLGVVIAPGSKHAEQNIANLLPAGSVVERWGISRSTHQTNIMCSDCQELLRTLGGIIE